MLIDKTAFPPVTFFRSIKAGLVSGLIAAGVNNLWGLIAQSLGSTPPNDFALSATVFTIFPILVSGFGYYLLMKFGPKGELIFLGLATMLTLASLYVPLSIQLQAQDFELKGFAFLTLPMHLIAASLTMWGVPRLANERKEFVYKSTFGEKIEIRRFI